MAKNSLLYKVILAIIIFLAVFVIVWIMRIPEKEDSVTEQIEEIEWENIDKITFTGKADIEIIKDDDTYQLLRDDTIIDVETERIIDLFTIFNQLRFANLKAIDFQEWSQTQEDSSAIILQLYDNTEEILNLYIHPKDRSTHFRYLGSREVYETQRITSSEFEWIDSLMNYTYNAEE